jgi:hypothetical protein
MTVGYIYQPIPRELVMASFNDANLFITDKNGVIESLTNIANAHANHIEDKMKAYREHGCLKFHVKSNYIKEQAWDEFIKTMPNKSYVIISDYSQITDSDWKLNEIIKDALKKEIYILDFSNAMMAEITFDKAYAYYNKMVLQILGKKVVMQKSKTKSDQIVDLTLNKHTVDQIIDIVGCSRSTVFRVRREAGLKERFYNI